MGMYKHIRKMWKRPKESLKQQWKERLFHWRRDPATKKLDKPTRLDKAKSVGYKSKPGVFTVRQRLQRTAHKRPDIKGGRRSKHNRQNMVLSKSYQQIAEERVNRKYVNCEVLNSYKVAEDGKYYWFEVIMVDRDNPSVLKDKELSKIASDKQHRRAYRGLTSASKKSR